MARISANLSGIERVLLNRLADATAAAATSTLRLATLQKINSPADDPSGFVALAGFQSQLSNVGAAMSNATAAASMVTQTQTALGQIQSQLTAIRAELLDPDDESQLAIDEAIAQIDALTRTEVDGRRTLDGSADFEVSGRDSTQVSRLTVYATGASQRTITGTVLQAAAQATLTRQSSEGALAEAQFTLSGSRGSTVIDVENAESLDSLAGKINAKSYLTGVTAAVDGGDLVLTSVGYGTGAEIGVDVTDGTFNVTGGNGDGTADGTAGTARINGRVYSSDAANGNRYTVSDNGLRFEIEFQEGFTGAMDTMTVSAGGLTFCLSADVSQTATLAIPGLQPGRLGGDSGRLDQIATGGDYAGLGDNTAQAVRIVDEAIAQVTRVQGNVSGFYNASISSASTLLGELEEDLQDAIDAMDLVDVAEEEVRLSYCEALAQNAMAGLAVLQQQRAGIVRLIQHIAGLD